MFFFRLNKVVIFDNGSIKSGLGLFGHDFSDVKFLSFVTPDNVDLPDMTELVSTTDATRRQTIIREAVSAVICERSITQVSRVTDNGHIVFGDTGYLLYQSDAIPEFFSWSYLAIKSNQGFRDTGEQIDDVLSDQAFGSFTEGLLTLLASGASLVNPAYAAGVAVAKFVAQATARSMMHSGDKELGLMYLSLSRGEHYPHGERKADDVPDLTNNMTCDYSIFAYEHALPV